MNRAEIPVRTLVAGGASEVVSALSTQSF